MGMTFTRRFAFGLKAAMWHFLITLGIAMLAAWLVFKVWYPHPLDELLGGKELFWIVIAVDLVCGPLLTLVMFNPDKSRKELAMDLSLVGLIQIAALSYGLYTVGVVRPVALAHEVDRIRAVSVVDIPPEDLAKAKAPYDKLSWTGPIWVGVRQPKDGDEQFESISHSLGGVEPSMRPQWWQPYEQSVVQVLSRAKPVSELRFKRVGQSSLIDQAVKASGKTERELVWLPLVSARASDWVVLLDAKTAKPLAYANVDGFI